MKLSQDEYLNHRGEFCPACADRTVTKHKLRQEGFDIVIHDAECRKCGSSWVAYYELAGFDTLVTPPVPRRGPVGVGVDD